MLTLYFSPSCPFCQRVLQVAENLKITFDLKDITADDATRAELIEKGGKGQVPYLVDTEKDVAMYESSDIIDYIRENKTASNSDAPAASKPKVHISDSVCESCEG
jgi:glutathione S-transferase